MRQRVVEHYGILLYDVFPLHNKPQEVWFKTVETPMRYNLRNIHEPYIAWLSIMVFFPMVAKGGHFEGNFICLYLKGVLTDFNQICNADSMTKALCNELNVIRLKALIFLLRMHCSQDLICMK